MWRRIGRAAAWAGLLLCAGVFFLPVLLILCGSLMTEGELVRIYEQAAPFFRLIPGPFTLEGYYRLLFANTAYLSAFWNSALLCVVTVTGQCAVSLIVGFALWRECLPGCRLLRYVYVFVMLLPFQVTMLPNYIQIRQMGLYNSIWALILPGVFSPLGVFLVCQFMKSVPQEIVDAALLETASPIRMLFYIIAPNVSHALLALSLITFAEVWNMVEQPLIFLKDTWRYPLSLALSQQSGSLSLAFAGAVIYMLPICFLFRIFRDSLLAGIEGVRQ